MSELLGDGDRQDMSQRWHAIQAAFVDDPRRAVHDADALVAGLLNNLARMFTSERDTLEGRWNNNQEVSTEDLRLAFQRYRTFFDRLLAV